MASVGDMQGGVDRLFREARQGTVGDDSRAVMRKGIAERVGLLLGDGSGRVE
jgi:hypothetical protein